MKSFPPSGKRASALITINLDAEQFWLGMFEGSEKRPKTLSMGDYGIARGLDRVLKTLHDYGVTSTFFVPGLVIENHPDTIEKILARGHELALHGHTHRPMHLLTHGEQVEEFEQSIAAYTRFTGRRPLGFRAPEGELTRDTLDIAAQMGFVYSSSLYDGDMPYAHAGLAQPLIEIPMNWSTHDFPYFAFNYGPAFPIGQSRVSSYRRVEENYILEFDAYREAGLTYVAQFTPQSIGSPGKIAILEHVLGHITSAQDTWVGTCAELIS